MTDIKNEYNPLIDPNFPPLPMILELHQRNVLQIKEISIITERIKELEDELRDVYKAHKSIIDRYGEAVDLLTDLKSTIETHAMQTHSRTSWKKLEQINDFLKSIEESKL